MARGKHLFPCRTQQLSLAAVTILGFHPWENSTVPNYINPLRKEELSFRYRSIIWSQGVNMAGPEEPSQERDIREPPDLSRCKPEPYCSREEKISKLGGSILFRRP